MDHRDAAYMLPLFIFDRAASTTTSSIPERIRPAGGGRRRLAAAGWRRNPNDFAVRPPSDVGPHGTASAPARISVDAFALSGVFP